MNEQFRVSKVFTLDKPYPIFDGDAALTQEMVVQILNELTMQNRHLKQEIKYLQRIRDNNHEQIATLETALKGYKTIEEFVKQYVEESKRLME